MNFFTNMLNLQLTLFILIIIGIFLKKKNYIGEEGKKMLSDLLINLILPCNIIYSFCSKIEIASNFVSNCILAIILSSCIQLTATFLSKWVFRNYPKTQKNVMSYGLICSNSSFIGLPVAECLYGSLGVLYTSIFQIPIRFTMWTAGLSLFTTVDKKDAFKKLLKHPCIISIFIGFLLMILPISLPQFVSNTISTLSKCTVPISMFVIGATLADANIKTLFSRAVLYYTVLRLIAFPVAVFIILRMFNLDPLLIGISVIMTGMPAGSTTAILAEKYGCDAEFASQIIFVSTLLSIFTIPLLSLLIK